MKGEEDHMLGACGSFSCKVWRGVVVEHSRVTLLRTSNESYQSYCS